MEEHTPEGSYDIEKGRIRVANLKERVSKLEDEIKSLQDHIRTLEKPRPLLKLHDDCVF